MFLHVVMALALSASPNADPAFPAMDSCFVIEAGDSLGTGFLVDGPLIVTAAHVVEGSRGVILETGETQPRRIRGEVVYSDEAADIAIIRPVTDPRLAPLAFDVSLPEQGDVVYAVGSPIGQLVASRGLVVGITSAAIEATTPVDPGSSGGPLLVEDGRVAGVVIEESMQSGNSFSVPASQVLEALEALDAQPVEATTPDIAPTTSAAPGWVPFVVLMTLLVALLALALSLLAWSRTRTRERNRIVVTLDEE